MLWFGLHSGSAPAVEARVYMLWYHMLWWRGRAVCHCAASVGVGRVFVPGRGINARDGHPVRLCVRRRGVAGGALAPRGEGGGYQK